MRKRLAVACAAAMMAATLLAPVVFASDGAAGPDNESCWGVVTSQRASTYHDLGSHASSQSTPRLGLANVARLLNSLGLLDEPTVWDLGSVLGDLDGLGATNCP